MVRGPRQTIQPAIRIWNVWKTSARKQSRNGAISPARLGISWSMGADLRAATILVGLSNPRISRRHGMVRSLLRHQWIHGKSETLVREGAKKGAARPTKERAVNNFPISRGLGNGPVVPLG